MEHSAIAQVHAHRPRVKRKAPLAPKTLARYRTALEAGTDPQLVATWTAEVQAAKAQAMASSRKATSRRRMTKQEIRDLVTALGNIRAVLADAEPADKAEVYRQLGLKLTYDPGKRTVGAEIALDAQSWGYGLCPEGDLHVSYTP